MRVLVTWGSKRGGTEGIARILGDALCAEGLEVELQPARKAPKANAFDAAIVGGALYGNRWHRDARRVVRRMAHRLEQVPVWFFSSGPLDDSAERGEIAPVRQVRALMAAVGARGHVTFGGRLAPDAHGIVASAMAREHAGDWRNEAQVRRWARDVAASLRAAPARGASTRPDRLGRVLSAACLFVGLTALGGGAQLVVRPDGSAVGLPLWLLRHTPFTDFLVPGLLLACVVGLGNAAASVLLYRRARLADACAMASGLALSVWIVVQVTLLRGVHWLHLVYLVLGAAIATAAALREHRAGRLGATVDRLSRLLVHGLSGWALCAAAMGALLATTNQGAATITHAVAAPLVFVVVSVSYFRRENAGAPLPVALAFTALVALLDLVVVASFILRSLAMFESVVGAWLPLVLIFLATWATGEVMSMLPTQPTPRVPRPLKA